MEDEEKAVKETARSIGYSVNRCFPAGWVIMERATGKNRGKFSTLQEVGAALSTLEPHYPKPENPETVGWSCIAQLPPDLPKTCSNGNGAGCLCLDQTFPYWCCAVGECHRAAGCRGVCTDHYGEVGKHGDLTAGAMSHTQKHVEDGTYDGLLADWESGQSRHVSLKRYGMATAPPSQSRITSAELAALKLPPGVSIRPIGDQKTLTWTLVDKDGNVLAEHSDPLELAKGFAEDD